jgi:hypothetical protein
MQTISDIQTWALELPETDRAALANSLWKSLKDSSSAMEIIDVELEERRTGAVLDSSTMISAEDFEASVMRRLAE